MKKYLLTLLCFQMFAHFAEGQTSLRQLEKELAHADSLKNVDHFLAMSLSENLMQEFHDRGLDSLWIKGATILAHIHMERGEYQKSNSVLDQAIALSKNKNLQTSTSDVMAFAANLFLKIGSYNKAMTYYSESGKISLIQDYKFGAMRANVGTGICNMYLHNLDTASILFHKALSIAEEIDNIRSQGIVKNNLGRLYKRKQEYDRAIKYINESIVLLEKVGKRNSIVRGQLLLAEIYLDKGESNQALEIVSMALDGSRNIKDYQSIVRAEKAIGDIYRTTNNYEEAIKHYLLAIENGEQFDIKQNLVLTLISYADLLIEVEDFDKAEEVINQGLVLAKKINNLGNTISLYDLMESKYALTNDLPKAYFISKKRKTLKDSIDQREKNELTERLETEYETEKTKNALNESQIALLENERTLFGVGVGTVLLLILGITFYVFINIRQKNVRLKFERNEAILREKNLEITKNKEIEKARAEIKGQEEERKRLAQELHDGLGGTLATIKLNLSQANAQLHDLVASEAVNTSFHLIADRLDDACVEVRTISHHLAPRAFEKDSLTATVKKYYQDIERGSHLEVSLDIFPEEALETLPPMTKNDLYRITQELTNNVLKHAEAKHLDVQLIQHEDYLSLMVEDDGKGFSLEGKEEGIGLKNIRSRVVLLNGTMHIDSLPSRGTLIDIQIPTQLKEKIS